MSTSILVIDNYDSFTYNLVHYLGELGASITVHRNDKISVDEIEGMAPDGIVLSPGPCTPDDAGIGLELVSRLGANTPIFGVCLGHQTIGQAYGATVGRAPTLMHGKLSRIDHTGRSVFYGLNTSFEATRYHSLTLEPDTVPGDVLEVTAHTADGVIMGAMHKTHPVHGVQFHPESIASEHGHRILGNFLEIANAWNRDHRDAR